MAGDSVAGCQDRFDIISWDSRIDCITEEVGRSGQPPKGVDARLDDADAASLGDDIMAQSIAEQAAIRCHELIEE